MKTLHLIKHPECFQGEKNLLNSSNYFEGWYFKISNGSDVICFIPGINIENGNSYAFIQIIFKEKSYYISYPFSEFSFSNYPFFIKIGKNIFSMNEINLNINDISSSLKINGKISFFDLNSISSNIFAPNIMGPFSYFSSMECNHAILSMHNKVKGHIIFNNKFISFNNGFAYIEKDWGTSFPQSYIWCQASEFSSKTASFMLSVAKVPFGPLVFNGSIAVLSFLDKEYKFTTYYGCRIKEFIINNNSFSIQIKQGNRILKISSISNNGLSLMAPVKGKMNKEILESISSNIYVELKENNNIVFSDTSINCGLEIVI